MGHILATASSDDTVRLWDGHTRRQTGSSLPGHTDAVNSVAFNPDGRTLATASSDRTVRLWDIRTHRQTGTPLIGHTAPIFSMVFSPNGRILATGGGEKDHTVRFWDVTIPANISVAVCAIAGRSLTQAEWARYVPAGVKFRTVCL